MNTDALLNTDEPRGGAALKNGTVEIQSRVPMMSRMVYFSLLTACAYRCVVRLRGDQRIAIRVHLCSSVV
jgi:hypothetical protein